MSVILFAGGGTGGHLMPALALAEAMVRQDPSVEPFFIGSLRGVEAGVLPRRPWRHVLLPLEPLRRKEWWKNLRLPWALYHSLWDIRAVLRRENPVLVVGTGGYVAGPVVWAAANRGVPAVIQEQNAHPGLATRRLAGRARQVHLGVPEARALLKPGPLTEVFDTGNPIRAPDLPPEEHEVCKARLGFEPGRPLVLVTGGSQGALGINRAVEGALASGVWPSGAQLLWQTGETTYARFHPLAVPGTVVVERFLDPIGPAYRAADVIVCRSGAMTLAEVAAWGLPAVLIPLPSSAAGHQHANAQAHVEAGAAVLVEQRDASGSALASVLSNLLQDPARMAHMREAALRRGRPDAADQIARRALALLSNS